MARQLFLPLWSDEPNNGRLLTLRSYHMDMRSILMENTVLDIAAAIDNRLVDPLVIDVSVEVPMPLNHISITLNVTQSPQQLELPLT